MQNEKVKLSIKQRIINSGVLCPTYIIITILFVTSLLIYLLSRISVTIAEFFARGPSQGIRFLISFVSTLVPFSVAEALLLFLPALAVSYLVYSFRLINKNEKQFIAKCLMPLVCIIMVIITIFCTAFAPSYFRKDLSTNLGLERKAVSPEELHSTAIYLCGELSDVLEYIDYNYTGASYLPYSYNELAFKVNQAFYEYAIKVDYINSFYSRPKPIALSQPMTYTHISGIYTFFTGEANVNVNYPDFILPFTMAHEMAHQRGIAREDEANFVAFLVCMQSNDPYVRYSGIANVLKYVMESLYSASKDLYNDVRAKYYPAVLKSEMSAFSLFFDKYRDSTASKVTNTTNNGFLKSQGQSAGIKSYNLVVDLAVAYYNSLG